MFNGGVNNVAVFSHSILDGEANACRMLRMKEITLEDCVDCVIVPGYTHPYTLLHPGTGRSIYGGETLEEIQKQYPTAIKMNYKEYAAERTARLNGPVTWNEITEAQFDEWLDCVPPVAFDGNSFMVGEPADHFGPNGAVRYQACFRRGGKHYASSRAMTVLEFKAARVARFQ